MKIDLVNYSDFQSTLIAPCGDTWLHQHRVEMFCRSEDEAFCEKVEIDHYSGRVMQKRVDNSQNPSDRRQGMRIIFSCETCEDGEHHLTIKQHKGMTYIQWEK